MCYDFLKQNHVGSGQVLSPPIPRELSDPGGSNVRGKGATESPLLAGCKSSRSLRKKETKRNKRGRNTKSRAEQSSVGRWVGKAAGGCRGHHSNQEQPTTFLSSCLPVRRHTGGPDWIFLAGGELAWAYFPFPLPF